MAGTRTVSGRRPAAAGWLLLVLTVLSGVLAMHALAPGGAATARHAGVMTHEAGHGGAASGTSHASGASQPWQATRQAGDECAHGEGETSHLRHADGMCAAAGVASSYAPPEPAPSLPDATAGSFPMGGVPASTDGGRAPPDLAELQLLRI